MKTLFTQRLLRVLALCASTLPLLLSETALASGSAPMIECPTDIAISAAPGETNALVAWIASADGSPVPMVNCRLDGTNISSPFRFPLGQSVVSCTASNVAGSTNCSFTVTVLCTPALLERAELARDIWPGSEGSSAEKFKVFRDALYFSADDPEHGDELWKFDGTNVTLVVDLTPGPDSSYPDELFIWKDTLYFSARSPAYGGELWKFDGTNVTLAADIVPGPDNSYPEEFVVFRNALYFTVERDPDHGSELWKYDGTNATRAADIWPGPDGSSPYGKSVLNDALYFGADDGANGYELWKFDGTNATLAADINPGPGSSYVDGVTAIGSTLYFRAEESTYGYELWKFDGTNAMIAADFEPGPGNSSPYQIIDFNGVPIIGAGNGAEGYELYRLDGTNLTMLTTGNPGPDNSYPFGMTVIGNLLFFSAEPQGFHKYDGTNVTQIAGVNSGANPIVPLQNGYYFRGERDDVGRELFRTDGTNAYLAADIVPGPQDGIGYWMAAFNGTLAFTAENNAVGEELWHLVQSTQCVTNAAPTLTCPGNLVFSTSPSNCEALVNFTNVVTGYPMPVVSCAVNGNLYYSFPTTLSPGNYTVDCTASNIFGVTNCSFTITVQDLTPPTLLCPPDLTVACDFYVPLPDFTGGFVMDGCDYGVAALFGGDVTNRTSPLVISRTWTAADSQGNSNSCVQRISVRMDFGLVADLLPGPDGSSPEEFAVFNGVLYFSAHDYAHGTELWRFDGTNATLAADINPGGNSSYPEFLTVFKNALYFQARDAAHGYELWKFDGTNATLAAEIQPGSDDSDPYDLTVFNGALYFGAQDNVHGGELWKFDGTNATLAADINPDGDSSYPEGLVVFNNALYFQAYDNAHGYELWRFDGTNAMLVADINPGYDDSYPREFKVFNQALYFQAERRGYGSELWKFDGTNATLAADINPGGNDSAPRDLVVFKGALYFRAYRSDLGSELWKFDGTNATLAADINPGSNNSSPRDLVVFNGALYFKAYDGVRGSELWRYDGTNAPQVYDLLPGGDSSYPKEMTVFQGALYFQAYDNAHGSELWQLGRPGPACPTEGAPTLSCSNLVVMADSGRCVAYRDVRPFPDFFPAPEVICTVNGEMIYGGRDFGPGTNHVVCTATNIYGGGACEFTVTVNVPPEQFGVVERFQVVTPVTPQFCCEVGYPFSVNREPVGTVLQGKLYYASSADGFGSELWTYNGTNATRITDLNQSGDANPHSLTVLGNYLYFSATDGANGYKPWRYDTTYGASQPGGIPVSDPEFLTVFDNDVFFSGIHGTNGRQIWRFHGSILPRVETSIPGGSDLIVRDLAVFNNSLHFVAGLGVNAQLWRLDSTGAVKVTSITPGIDVMKSWLAVLGSALYFTADDGAHGIELWKYDGASATRVTDINFGPAGSNPSWLTAFNGSLYFTAENAALGAELWRFDGTSASPVTDIQAGSGSSTPHSLKVAGDHLYFAANMRVHNFGFLDAEERLFRFDGQRLEFIDRFGGGSFMCRGKVLTGMADYQDALYFRYSDDCQFARAQQLARIARSFACRDDSYASLDCPGDVTVAASPDECGAWFVVPRPYEYNDSAFPAALITCRSGSTVFNASHYFPVGVHPMTCTASNRYNVDRCSFTLTITAPLQIVCPGDLLANVSATATSAVVSFSVSASGECSPLLSTNCVPPSGSAFPLGTSTVTCTVSNAGGLTASCSFNVTVAPNRAPRFVCDSPVLRLNGSDGRVRVPGFGNLAPTEEITIEFWQKVNAARGQSTFILDPNDGSNLIQAHVPWDDGSLYWDFGDAGGNGRSSYSLASEAIATWQHFALVSSVSQDKTRVYRNGLLEHEENHAGSFSHVNSDLLLGGNDGIAFGGLLAEFRVWQGARSGADITANYQRRLTGAEAGLVAYYPLDETSGTQARDLSPKANHGTLEGGAGWILSDLPVACPPRLLALSACMGNTAAGILTNAVSDADGQALRVVWFLDGVPVQTNDVAAGGPPSFGELTFSATFSSGAHSLVATATDTFGDSSSQTNLIHVGDNLPPQLICPADLTAMSAPGASTASVTFTVTAVDLCDTNPVVNCEPASGSTFPAGTNTVTCTATDASGNSNTCSFRVIVCPSLVTVLNTNDVGPGSLRQAIVDVCPGGTITFDPALRGQTIVLSTVGDNSFGPSALSVNSIVSVVGLTGNGGITLAGPGGGTNLRAFHVAAGGNLTLQYLTLRDFAALGDAGSAGSSTGAGGGGGGAGGAGGAVLNQGQLIVQFCTFSGNQALGGAGGRGYANNGNPLGTGGNGGGTAGGAGGSGNGSGGSGGFFSGGGGGGGNQVSPGAGGVGGFGGGGGGSGGRTGGGSGPAGGASSFGGGSGGLPVSSGAAGGGGGAGLGGAIFNHNGTVAIVNSTLVSNSASGGAQGGGAFEAAGGSAGTPGQGLGGAIFSRNGSVNITNSTISGNPAPGGGRGVFLVSDGSGAQAVALINNSILGQADNSINDFARTNVNGGLAPASSGVGNLIRKQTTFGGISSPADPLLDPLASNGGPTFTLALKTNSPARDAGTNALAAGLLTDQRGPGFARLSNGSVDIGAVEFQINSPPVLACPPIAITNDLGQCSALVTFPASVSGVPVPVVACTLGGLTISSPHTFPIGTNLVTCTATNLSGTNTCAFTVTVRDAEAPALSCPGNQVASTSSINCLATVTFSVTAADNCDTPIVVCSPMSGSSFAVGTNTVTCTATDAAGNTNTCSFTVTVRDTMPPAISCPSNKMVLTAPDSCLATVTFAPTATDNCGTAMVACSPPSGSSFAVGTNTVTCTASDAAGNTNSCSFTVTVRDTTPPVINCPTNQIVFTAPGTCATNVSFAATATDNCGTPVVACSPIGGSSFAVGTNTVTCAATDGAGYTNTCSFTITVRDITPPVINCPGNISITADAAVTPTNLTYAVAATDNCTVVSTNCSPASGSAFPLGVTTVNCVATDASGNTNTCSFTVTVCSPLITVVNTNDAGVGSLRWAISNVCDSGTITFAPSLKGSTIGLTSGELVINKSLAILGLGATNLSVSGNASSRVFSFAPGVTNLVSGLTITRGNSAGAAFTGYGGGILSRGAMLTLSNCVMLGNHAPVNGGGIATFMSTNVLFATTIASNRSDYAGGGLYAEDSSHTIVNSTFSANQSPLPSQGEGGGIFFEFGTGFIRHSTFAGNVAPAGASGGLFNHLGTVQVQNSLFAKGTSGENIDGNGTTTSLGYNLSDDDSRDSANALFLNHPSDKNNLPALLGPLANNGGPTLTHALMAGSPAVNAGDAAFNTNGLAFDQRGPGYPRVLAGRLDIGAYETIDFDPYFGCEISRWRFDETNGVAALDSSGVNLGTLVNGPVRVPGRVGSGALQLDGVDDFVRIPDHPSLSLRTNWSLSMWFKPSQLLNASSGRRDLFKKFTSYWLLFNYPANDGKIAFVFNTGSPIIKSTTSSWPANQWQHVAATYDGAMMRLYINGVLEAATATNNAIPNVTTAPIELGGSTEYRNFYRGCVDDVRIFCTNLAPATVMAIYDGSIILPPPPPPPTNTPPLISDIPNITLITNASSLQLPFTVSDGQTPVSNLVVTAVSDNQTLLPNANLFLADYVSNRVVQVTPAPNRTGVAIVTVTVTDGGGATNADIFTVSVTAPAPPTTGCLISHWNFNEASGSTAFDVADGNPGTLVGSPVRASGLSGSALFFNGVNNYVNVPDSDSLDLTNQFSISLWFQPNTLLNAGSGRHDLLKKFLSYWFILNYPANDGKLAFVLNSGSPVVKSTTASWPAGQWQHVVATYDGITLKLYVNGVLEANAPASVSPVKNTAPLQIGGNSDQQLYFPGGMDEVRLYGCALTAGDITGLFNQGGATNPPPPLNTPPTITDIANRTIAANSHTGDIPFTVGDAQTSAGSLVVTATSTNTALVPNGNLLLGGGSGARTIRVTPAANVTGITLITVTVSDGVFSTNDTFLVTVTNAPPPPPSGTNLLISRWQFDEASGPTALDSFGPNPGTLVNGPSRVAGTIGSGALLFDGINDHVNVPDNNSLDLSNRFTIAFWFKPSALLNGASGRKDLLQKFLSYWILLNYPANDGRLAFVLNSGTPLVKSTTASWASNQWYHLAATYDGTAMRLYINGVLEGTALTTLVPANTANALQFGGNTTQGFWFPGALDDVRLYGNPLSADAVTALYGGLSPLLPPGGIATTSPAMTITVESENDLVVLKWTAQAGRSYRVEYTDDLATGDWTALPGSVTVTGTSARTEDTLGLSTQRFYRVVIEP